MHPTNPNLMAPVNQAVAITAPDEEQDDASRYGQIKVVTMDDRKTAWVRENRIAAFVALREDGPCRLIFDGGGYLDVCGSAEIFRREARIIELEREKRHARS